MEDGSGFGVIAHDERILRIPKTVPRQLSKPCGSKVDKEVLLRMRGSMKIRTSTEESLVKRRRVDESSEEWKLFFREGTKSSSRCAELPYRWYQWVLKLFNV